MQKYKTDRLKARIAEKFGTQHEFAKASGIHEATLSRYLNHGRAWSGANIIKAIRLLEITDDEVDALFFASVVDISQPKRERKVTR